MSTSSIGSRRGHAVLEPLQRGTGRSARGSRRARRSARRGPRRPAGRRAAPTCVAHRRQHGRALGVDERLVEPAEPHAAGQVADDGEPQLGGEHQPVEHLARGRGQRPGRRGPARAIQRCSSAMTSWTSGAERCWARNTRNTASSSSRVRSRLVDAVVAQHPQQPLAELLGQAAPLDVQALQVGVEVLPRAVHAVLDVLVLAGRPVAAQLGEVGEQREQRRSRRRRGPRPRRRGSSSRAAR